MHIHKNIHKRFILTIAIQMLSAAIIVDNFMINQVPALGTDSLCNCTESSKYYALSLAAVSCPLAG